ncbi:hypothetical protein JOQ06_011927, partial [Pogonophryne albipinna]
AYLNHLREPKAGGCTQIYRLYRLLSEFISPKPPPLNEFQMFRRRNGTRRLPRMTLAADVAGPRTNKLADDNVTLPPQHRNSSSLGKTNRLGLLSRSGNKNLANNAKG